MRSHSSIIKDAGGPTVLHRTLGLEDEKLHAVRSWFQRDSIPPEYWPTMVDHGLATLDELALAAEAKRLPEVAAARQDAAA
jgi:hypothetical protein